VGFADCALPFLNEIHELVRLAARAFMPLRTVGLGCRDHGHRPSLIEGNVYWDPLPHGNLRAVVIEAPA